MQLMYVLHANMYKSQCNVLGATTLLCVSMLVRCGLICELQCLSFALIVASLFRRSCTKYAFSAPERVKKENLRVGKEKQGIIRYTRIEELAHYFTKYKR